METIYHQIIIDSTKDTVLESLTTSEGISGWWLSECEVGSSEGFVNKFYYDGKLDLKMVVTEVDKSSVKWRCIFGVAEWLETEISFKLSCHGDYLKLDFRHSGWSEQSEFFGTCNYHWGRHLKMLKDYCETGKKQLVKAVENREIEMVKGD